MCVPTDRKPLQERSHQGRLMNGRVPLKAFIDGLPKKEKDKTLAKAA